MAADFSDVLFGPARFFMERPALAFLPAALFGLLFATHLLSRRRGERRWEGALVLLAALFWFAYGCWESYMFRWSKTVVAPIRVDLLLLAPGVYVSAVVGLVAGVLANRRPRGGS